MLFAASRQVVRIERRAAQLGRDLLTTVEDERRRIAREIHDGVGQTLQAVKMRYDLRDQSAPAADRIGTEDLGLGLDMLRSVAQELRPVELDEGELVDQIANYAEGFSYRAQLRLKLDLVDAPLGNVLDRQVGEHVFRIVQEALGNVARHAQATVVKLKIAHRAGRFELGLVDDGVGFSANGNRNGAEPGGIGFATMRERAELIGARLEVYDAAPGVGVHLSLEARGAD